MLDFLYHTPTKVYFGKGKHKDVGNIIREFKCKKVMFLYGKGSIKENGLYEDILTSLIDNNIEYVEFGGVEPNPKLSFVREAIVVARENSVEMILAVGGGSVIDAAKYIASGTLSDCDVWDFVTRKESPKRALPVGCILTISAAGSEMSSSAVITNEGLHMKRGFNSEFNRCKFAICNPELTYSVSKYQTACGIVDIMSHTMERYFSVCEDTDLTDRIAESVLKSVISAGRVAIDNPFDYEARATLMWASSLSHNDLTGCGRAVTLAVHQLEHALSGEYDHIAHGAGLAVLFPAWARYVLEYNIERFAQFARRVWDVDEISDEYAAKAGVEKMAEFFVSIGMPATLDEFGLNSDSCEKLAQLCTFNNARTVKSYIELDFDKIKEIFKSAFAE